MAKLAGLFRQISEEIYSGHHGAGGERFMPVRTMAEKYSVSLASAHRLLKMLKEEKLLIADSTNPAVINSECLRLHAFSEIDSIGLVISNIASPFFSKLCRSIQLRAAEDGVEVFSASSDYNFEREREIIQKQLAMGVKGLLICPGVDERCAEFYRDLIAQGVRLVFVSRHVDGVDADFVCVHNFIGALAIGRHLAENKKRIAYISFGLNERQDMRLCGFRSGLSESGIKLQKNMTINAGGWDVNHGYQAMKKLLAGKKKPDAVFAFNDLLAIGAMRCCQDMGIEIPADMAIAGFDNLPESKVTTPQLTTVNYPVDSMANLAVRTLLENLRDPKVRPANKLVLEPQILVRQSTDSQAPEDMSDFEKPVDRYYLI